MSAYFKVFYVVLITLVLSACGSGGSESGGDNTETPDKSLEDSPSVVLNQKRIETSQQCPNGGVEIETGIDTNGNGILDSNEVSRTHSVCYGQDAGSRPLQWTTESVTTSDECPRGGSKVIGWFDTNNNGQLDQAERDEANSFMLCWNNSAPIAREWIYRYPTTDDSLRLEYIIDMEQGEVVQSENFLYALDYEKDDFEVSLQGQPEWLSAELSDEYFCEEIDEPGSYCGVYPQSRRIEFTHSHEPPVGEYQFQILLDDGKRGRNQSITYRVSRPNQLTWTTLEQAIEGTDEYAFMALSLAEAPDHQITVEFEADRGPVFICTEYNPDACALILASNDRYFEATFEPGQRELIFMTAIPEDDVHLQPLILRIDEIDTDNMTSAIVYLQNDQEHAFDILENDPLQQIGFVQNEKAAFLQPGQDVSIPVVRDSTPYRTSVGVEVESSLIEGFDYRLTYSTVNFYTNDTYKDLRIELLRPIAGPAEMVIRLVEGNDYALQPGKEHITLTINPDGIIFGVKTPDIVATPNLPVVTAQAKGPSGKLYLAGSVSGTIESQEYRGGTSDAWYGIWSDQFQTQQVVQFGTGYWDKVLAIAPDQNDNLFLLVRSEGEGEIQHTLYKFHNGIQLQATHIAFPTDREKTPGKVWMTTDGNDHVYVLAYENCCGSDYQGDTDYYQQGFSLQKLNAAGERVWIQDDLANLDTGFRINSTFSSLMLDNSGRPVLALEKASYAPSTQLDWPGGTDWLVIQLNPDNGLVEQHIQLGSTAGDSLKGAEISATGEIMLWGASNAGFQGELPLLKSDAVVVKLASDFSVAWINQFGSYDNDSLLAGTLDTSGNLYLHARFEGEFNAQFDTHQFLKIGTDGQILSDNEIQEYFSLTGATLNTPLEDGTRLFAFQDHILMSAFHRWNDYDIRFRMFDTEGVPR